MGLAEFHNPKLVRAVLVALLRSATWYCDHTFCNRNSKF
jgi:hypothetical protein